MIKFFTDIKYLFPHHIIYYGYKWFFNKRFKLNQNRRTIIKEDYENSLLGFDKYKCIFIHIPKAAGVSLSISLFGNLGGGHQTIYSYYKIFSPKEFSEYYKFVIVRNPWDRLVSAYHFLKEGGFNSKDKDWFEKNLRKFETFEDFICLGLDQKEIYSFTHFIPQHHYIYLNGNLLVDTIYKFEKMDNIYIDLNKKLNVNISNIHSNKTQNRNLDYRKYYNKETELIVQRIYSKDISLFNYTF